MALDYNYPFSKPSEGNVEDVVIQALQDPDVMPYVGQALVTPTNAAVPHSINDILGRYLDEADYADLPATLVKAKALAPRDYQLTPNTWSTAAGGWKKIKIPAGVHTFSTPLTFISSIGLLIEGEGTDATSLVFTGTSGDFLKFSTPINVTIRDLTIANGSVATGPNGTPPRQQVTIYDPRTGATPQTTARGIVFDDSGGATKWRLDNVSMQGFADQIVPQSTLNVNCDSLLETNGTYRWCNRHLVVDCDQALLLRSIHCKYHHIYDKAIHVTRGGHVLVDDADVIIPGVFFYLEKIENGQSPHVLNQVRMEGYQSFDPAQKPKLLQITAGNEGEVVIRDFENCASTDVAANVVQIDGGVVNVTFEHSHVLGRIAATSKSYSSGQNYDKYAIIKFRDCRGPVISTNITLTGQAADGVSKYTVKYRGCALVPDMDIGGAVGGFSQHQATILQWYMSGNVRRLSTTTAVGTNNQTLPTQCRVRDIRVLTGSGVGNGTSIIKFFKDVAMTQQIGTDLTLAAANTLYSVSGAVNTLVTAAAFSCSQAVTSDVFGSVFIEIEPCYLVNP